MSEAVAASIVRNFICFICSIVKKLESDGNASRE